VVMTRYKVGDNVRFSYLKQASRVGKIVHKYDNIKLQHWHIQQDNTGDTFCCIEDEMTLTPQFKVGDKVRIIARNHNHRFDIGLVVEIKRIGDVIKRSYFCEGLYKDNITNHPRLITFYVYYNDIEHITEETQMTKSDLRDGMIIKYANGTVREVKGNILVDAKGKYCISLDRFKENLDPPAFLGPDYIIVQVLTPWNRPQPPQKTQKELVAKIKRMTNINVVTCGDCGTILFHEMKRDIGELKCPDCGFNDDICHFPDLY